MTNLSNGRKGKFDVVRWFSEWILTLCICTLTWNGLSDQFTNATYLIIVFYALFERIKLSNSYKLQYYQPLLAAIIVSTFFAVLFGQSKLEVLNLLEDQFFSSIRPASSQSSIYSPFDDLVPAVKWCLAIVSLPFLVQVMKLTNTKLLRRTTYAWILGLLFNIAIQLFQFFNLPIIGLFTNPKAYSLDSRFPGLATHPNALAISVCLTVPLLFLAIVEFHKIVKLIIILSMIFSVYVTESRAGLIVLSLTLFIILITQKDSGKISLGRVFSIFTGLSLIFFLGFAAKTLSLTRFSSSDSSSRASNSERLQLLQYGWNSFLHYPITGAGSVNLKVSHNIYLQVLSSIGFLGFVCFAIFMIHLVYSNQINSFYERLPAVVFLCFGLFNNSLSDFYLYFPIGFAYSLITFDRKNY